MIRTEEQMRQMMMDSMEALKGIFEKEGPMRVPQTDDIVNMIFAYFFANSLSSIPAEMRREYLEVRMIELSKVIAVSAEEYMKTECPGCKDGTHSKTTHFNA